jgi:hypothetical protein
MHGSNHCRLGDARNEALLYRGSCCDSQRMTIKTPFANKVRRSVTPSCLAADAPERDLRAHFLRMASTWTELADQLRVLH